MSRNYIPICPSCKKKMKKVRNGLFEYMCEKCQEVEYVGPDFSDYDDEDEYGYSKTYGFSEWPDE